MDLKTYLKGLGDDDARTAFADACGTSVGHLRNCIYDPKKRLAAETCVLVEKVSGCAVTRRELRDDWHRIWPELVTEEFPAPATEAA